MLVMSLHWKFKDNLFFKCGILIIQIGDHSFNGRESFIYLLYLFAGGGQKCFEVCSCVGHTLSGVSFFKF